MPIETLARMPLPRRGEDGPVKDGQATQSPTPYWTPAILALAAIIGALAWVHYSPTIEPLRLELAVAMVLCGVATVVAAVALFARVRAAQTLDSIAERFLRVREAVVHASIAWVVCFAAMLTAVVALRLLRVDSGPTRGLGNTSAPTSPQLPERRVAACCHDFVRGVCEPCAASTFCAQDCSNVSIGDR